MHIAAMTGEHASSETGQGPSPRLVAAAHEFEAQMMKELLKPMMGQDGLTGDESDAGEDSGATGALGEFAAQALGQALSQAGGFGIADRIVKELSVSGKARGTRESTDTHQQVPQQNSVLH